MFSGLTWKAIASAAPAESMLISKVDAKSTHYSKPVENREQTYKGYSNTNKPEKQPDPGMRNESRGERPDPPYKETLNNESGYERTLIGFP